jgi:hypothetical protein
MLDNIAELDKEILKYIEQKTAKRLVRNCARNSMHHLERAFKIKDVDPEMAVFRSITAEEEAATAIFIALKEKHYNNADKIQYKKHPYKQALGPFIRAIGKFSSNISNSPGFPFGKKREPIGSGPLLWYHVLFRTRLITVEVANNFGPLVLKVPFPLLEHWRVGL